MKNEKPERKRTSVEFTDVTAPIMEELRAGNWDMTVVLNAGICAFSQLSTTQKNAFRAMAYGLDSIPAENARQIFRKWVLELVDDALANQKDDRDDPVQAAIDDESAAAAASKASKHTHRRQRNLKSG